MRVLEESASTSCAIMSEEKNLNGTESDGCNSKKVQAVKIEQNHSPNNDNEPGYTTSGGRLKFFKDGKFILELSHRRDGEKMSWIPVPKKTYWPPPVTTSSVVNCIKQESTASLSVSDDNSSVQLSPWQRDHCWKQSSPRKAVSLEMSFLMMPLPRAFQIRKANSLTIKRKRRRPFDLIEKAVNDKILADANGFQRPVKLKNCAIKNGGLNSLIQRLWEYCLKSSESAQSVQKHSPSVFSPRKRILREFERVSLVTNSADEQSQLNLKRQRPKSSTNGQSPTQSNSKGVSNYSITSLLGTKEEPQDQESPFLRTLLRSPKKEPSPEPSPKSRRNSPSSSDGKRDNAQTTSSPPSSESALRNASFPSMQFPYMHSPMLYPHFLPPQSVAHHPPYFAMPSTYRSSSSALWGVHYHPLSSLPHPGTYHGIASPYSPSQFNYWHPQPLSEAKREDASSDVPLNLSKHGG